MPEAGANGSYRRLTAGPGYAFEVREDALDRPGCSARRPRDEEIPSDLLVRGDLSRCARGDLNPHAVASTRT